MARRPTKPKSIADWQITKIGKVARYVGQVQAPDAEAAIRRAIEKFEIAPGAPGPDRSSADRYRVMSCPHCRDTGWVCEEHPNKPMDHEGCTGGVHLQSCRRGTLAGATAGLPGRSRQGRVAALK